MELLSFVLLKIFINKIFSHTHTHTHKSMLFHACRKFAIRIQRIPDALHPETLM